MIRKRLKKKRDNQKINEIVKKYKIPRVYLSINRKSISRGVFLGLFIAFIPMPMQMLAVIMFTPFFKFNVPIAISLVWITNPFTMPFVYYIEYKTGVFLLNRKSLENIELTLNWFSNNWDNIVIPLYVGTIPYSVFISIFFYYLINILWISSVKREINFRLKRDKK